MIAKRRRVHDKPHGFDLERGHKDRRWLSACAGKARYSSEAAARAGIGLQVGAPALDVYPCDHCHGWHLTECRPAGQRKAAPPVHMLAFVCGRCGALAADVAASAQPWSPERRRVALLSLEPIAIRAGWSIGVEQDHCPSCAVALGLPTDRHCLDAPGANHGR